MSDCYSWIALVPMPAELGELDLAGPNSVGPKWSVHTPAASLKTHQVCFFSRLDKV